jgi:hypothetical protein
MAGLETRGFAPSYGMPGEPGPGPDPFGPGMASYGARTAPGGQFGEAGGLGDFGGLPGEMQDASPPGEEPNGKAFGKIGVGLVPLGRRLGCWPLGK